MANEEQLAILRQGAKVWNKWRKNAPEIEIDLREANLRKANLGEALIYGVDLSSADFTGANLQHANFSESNLSSARFTGADLHSAHFFKANLSGARLAGAMLMKSDFTRAILNSANLKHSHLYFADFNKANLIDADFTGARLDEANFSEANLTRSNFSEASLLEVNFTKANLTDAKLIGADLTHSNKMLADISGANISGSKVYGVNVWDIKGEFIEQNELIITPEKESIITVDNIEIAQFVYLILNNKKIRNVVNTLTSKTVLILGRFSIQERKIILDALRKRLRENDLLPIVFDFDRPSDKDFTETIKTLAGLCYFVIADVTNPKSSPLELQATVPDYQIPFVPIIQEGESPFAMMVDLQNKYSWVLPTVTYDSMETLIKVLKPLIIDPAMKKRNELRIIKAQVPEAISGRDFLDKGKE